MKKYLFLNILAIFGAIPLLAQQPQGDLVEATPKLHGSRMLDPITWKWAVTSNSNDVAVVTFNVAIQHGWHLYGLDLPKDGPYATSITFDPQPGVEEEGPLTPSRKPITKYDNVFNLNLSWWDADVAFTQHLLITDSKAHTLEGTIEFQACNDQTCIAPKRLPFSVVVGTGHQAVASADTAAVAPDAKKISENSSKGLSVNHDHWWAPVTEIDTTSSATIAQTSWWVIFLWGFGGGLLALLTPCVWPLIPMTVSFFLKKGGHRRKALADALTYGISIIVIYLALGLAVTAIFGATKLNELSTNAIFNIAFFALLVLFGISFLGGFEITLPSRWSNSADSRAERATGLMSIFFMAFTLALVSFSCTGPIIGTLLVEAATMGNFIGPAIGMAGFAIALALPFSLFALFPSWLKDIPRSGGWLNSVKVVLGFLELALSLKFLSVADLAYGWGILDREVFICLWVVIFALLAVYLLGKLRFAHDDETPKIGVGRFCLALVSLSFALYLVPGLWGAPLKSVSAFVPPLFTQDFSLYAGGDFEEFDDYDAGMAYAQKNNRPVLVDFSGFGCVNCRKMENAVFDTPRVRQTIQDNFVLIKLMVDDKTKLSKPFVVKENGKTLKLRTIGEKWSYLQRYKFGANSQPYYIALDNQGEPLVSPRFYDENIDQFIAWLTDAMKKYQQEND